MEPITLAAYFDGNQICLDEPYELLPNSRLLVTVLDESVADNLSAERADWLRLSAKGLARAYGDAEPEYPLTRLKEINTEYVAE